MSLRDTILSKNDRQIEAVEIPEWGETVNVRSWTGAERDAVEARFMQQGKKNNHSGVRAYVACMSVCNEDGSRVFEDKDEAKLGQLSASALDRILTVAMRLNRFGQKDVDELAGNS